MRVLWFKRRDYPIQRDENGRSLRQQSFEFFNEGYRPAQVFKQNLVAASMKTLLRYFEDWKKQKHQVPHSILRKYMKEHPDYSEKWIETVADYFEVTPGAVILRMQKPWGLMDICRGKLPDKKMERKKSQIERRLDSAIALINLGERNYGNSTKQIAELLKVIVTLQDNTVLTVVKHNGRLEIDKHGI